MAEFERLKQQRLQSANWAEAKSSTPNELIGERLSSGRSIEENKLAVDMSTPLVPPVSWMNYNSLPASELESGPSFANGKDQESSLSLARGQLSSIESSEANRAAKRSIGGGNSLLNNAEERGEPKWTRADAEHDRPSHLLGDNHQRARQRQVEAINRSDASGLAALAALPPRSRRSPREGQDSRTKTRDSGPFNYANERNLRPRANDSRPGLGGGVGFDSSGSSKAPLTRGDRNDVKQQRQYLSHSMNVHELAGGAREANLDGDNGGPPLAWPGQRPKNDYSTDATLSPRQASETKDLIRNAGSGSQGINIFGSQVQRPRRRRLRLQLASENSWLEEGVNSAAIDEQQKQWPVARGSVMDDLQRSDIPLSSAGEHSSAAVASSATNSASDGGSQVIDGNRKTNDWQVLPASVTAWDEPPLMGRDEFVEADRGVAASLWRPQELVEGNDDELLDRGEQGEQINLDPLENGSRQFDIGDVTPGNGNWQEHHEKGQQGAESESVSGGASPLHGYKLRAQRPRQLKTRYTRGSATDSTSSSDKLTSIGDGPHSGILPIWVGEKGGKEERVGILWPEERGAEVVLQDDQMAKADAVSMGSTQVDVDNNLIGPQAEKQLSIGQEDDESLLWQASQYLYMHMRAKAASSIYGVQVDVEWSNERVNGTVNTDQQGHTTENMIEQDSVEAYGHFLSPFATIDLVPGQDLHLQCTGKCCNFLST